MLAVGRELGKPRAGLGRRRWGVGRRLGEQLPRQEWQRRRRRSQPSGRRRRRPRRAGRPGERGAAGKVWPGRRRRGGGGRRGHGPQGVPQLHSAGWCRERGEERGEGSACQLTFWDFDPRASNVRSECAEPPRQSLLKPQSSATAALPATGRRNPLGTCAGGGRAGTQGQLRGARPAAVELRQRALRQVAPLCRASVPSSASAL